MKEYCVCIEKDIDIVKDAQLMMDCIDNDWYPALVDSTNPTAITIFKWVKMKCNDIEKYKNIVYNIDTVRIIECVEIEK